MPRALQPGARGKATTSRYRDGTWRAQRSVRLHDGSLYKGDQRGPEEFLAIQAVNDELERALNAAPGDTTLFGPWLSEWMKPRVDAAFDPTLPVPRGQRDRWDRDTTKAYRSAFRNVWPESAPQARVTNAGRPDRRYPDRSHIRGLGAMIMSEITHVEIEAFFQSMLTRDGGGYRSCELAAGLIAQAFDDAFRDGIIRTNPMSRARVPKRPRSEKVQMAALDEATINQVHSALTVYQQRSHVQRHGHTTRWTDVWTVLRGTGARIGEVMAIRWRDVNVEAGQVTIAGTIKANGQRSDQTKGRQHRTISVGGMGMAVLRRRLDDAGSDRDPEATVFATRRGTTWAPGDFRDGLRSALRAAGIEQGVLDRDGRIRQISPHGLRRTVGTKIAETEGVVAAQRHLGHASSRTTEEAYVRHVSVVPDLSQHLD